MINGYLCALNPPLLIALKILRIKWLTKNIQSDWTDKWYNIYRKGSLKTNSMWFGAFTNKQNAWPRYESW